MILYKARGHAIHIFKIIKKINEVILKTLAPIKITKCNIKVVLRLFLTSNLLKFQTQKILCDYSKFTLWLPMSFLCNVSNKLEKKSGFFFGFDLWPLLGAI